MLKKGILINLLILFFSIIFFFAIGEIVCRIYPVSELAIMSSSLGASYASNEEGENIYIDKNDGLVYDLLSHNIRIDRYIKLSKPQDISKEKEDGVFRVVVVGDSHTCGAGLLDLDNLYTNFLYEELNAEVGNHNNIQNFEILSICDGGLNTMQEYVLLKKIGLGYNPDFLILQYCDNDIEGIMSPIKSADNKISQNIYTSSNVLILNGRVVLAFPFIGERLSRVLLSKSRFLEFVSYKMNIIYSNKMMTKSESFHYIKKIKELAVENDMHLILFNFVPAKREDYCHNSESGKGVALHKQLEVLAEEYNIEFYNMCEYVPDINSIKSTISEENDHYDKGGNLIVSDILKNSILNRINE